MKLPAEACPEPNKDSPVYRRGIEQISDRVVDYSEYMWMGEEMEEFDRECLEQILEDDFIEMCMEEMLEEENEVYDYIQWVLEEYTDRDEILQHLEDYAKENNIELEFLQDPTLKLTSHQLNPEAPEFIPQTACASHTPVLPPDGPFDR